MGMSCTHLDSILSEADCTQFFEADHVVQSIPQFAGGRASVAMLGRMLGLVAPALHHRCTWLETCAC